MWLSKWLTNLCKASKQFCNVYIHVFQICTAMRLDMVCIAMGLDGFAQTCVAMHLDVIAMCLDMGCTAMYLDSFAQTHVAMHRSRHYCNGLDMVCIAMCLNGFAQTCVAMCLHMCCNVQTFVASGLDIHVAYGLHVSAANILHMLQITYCKFSRNFFSVNYDQLARNIPGRGKGFSQCSAFIIANKFQQFNQGVSCALIQMSRGCFTMKKKTLFTFPLLAQIIHTYACTLCLTR